MTTTTTPARAAATDRTSRTRKLLTCGVLAGPVFVGTALVQASTREGFDLTRHPASLLSNGSLGFIQITNFLVSGLLTIAAAAGIRRVLRGRGGTWGPRLLAVYGVSLVCAGFFRADPQDGFPAGTPAGPPSSVSWHGMAHFTCGAIGFLSLIIACFVLGSRFAAADGERGRAWHSRITGVLFVGGFVGIASGSANPAIVLGFWAAVTIAWIWLATTSAHLARRAGA
jgi:hypothetical protein